MKRPEHQPVPLAWLTVSGGARRVPAGGWRTYSPQLEITILETWVAAV